METFTTDPNILWCATLPIFFITIIASILRQYVASGLNGGVSQQKINLEESADQTHLFKSKALRTNGTLLPLRSFIARRAYFVKPGTGVLCQERPSVNPFQNLLSNQGDPTAMMGALKKQFVLLFLSGGIGYLINYFFSGFLVAKAPFPLPYKFKSMLQRGVDVPHSDPTFVSSLSWYFFVLVSSSQFVTLLYHLWGDDKVFQLPSQGFTSAASALYPGMGMADPSAGGAAMLLPGMGAPDFGKLFPAEKQALEIMTHTNDLDVVRERVKRRFKEIDISGSA